MELIAFKTRADTAAQIMSSPAFAYPA